MSQYLDQCMRRWIGRTLIDRAGERVGRVEDIYTDDVGGHPAWITVATGRFGLNIVFLPFAAAVPSPGNELRVLFPNSLIKDAPAAGKGGRLTQDEVVRLYDHYGFDLEAEEVRERLSHRRSSGLRTDYKPRSRYVPVAAEEPLGPDSGPAAPRVRSAPAEEPGAAVEHVAAAAEGPGMALVPVAAASEEPGVFSVPVVAASEEPGAAVEQPAAALKATAAALEPVAAPDEAPAAAAKEPSSRPTGSLFRNLVDLAEQREIRPDSPLFWNHDDRIDSIRPPREPARPGRR